MLTLFIVFVLSISYYVYFRSTRAYLYKLSRSLPSTGAVPVLGHTHWFIGGPERLLQNIRNLISKMEANGGIGQVWIGPALYIVVTNPEDIQIMFEKTLQKDGSTRLFRPWLGNGLLVAPVDIWKARRRVVYPIFNNRLVESFISVFGQHCEVLVKVLEETLTDSEFDVFEYISRCTADIVFEAVLGAKLDLQQKPVNPLASAFDAVMSVINMRLFKPWLQIDAIFNLTPYAKIQKENIDIIHRFTEEIIKKKRLLNENLNTSTEGCNGSPVSIKNQSDDQDIVDMLLTRNGDASDEELREYIDSITVAGLQSTSLVTSYALVLLGSHLEEQDKAYKELKQIFGDSNRIPTKEDLAQLDCLERVIKETMRLYPVVPIIGRQTQAELKLSNCIIPAGVACAAVPLVLHRSKKLWGLDADQFRPDRFLPEHSADRHPCTFIPFGSGGRFCIGRHFGMLVMKSLLTSILRSYEITAKPCGRVKIKILLFPVEGHMISLKRRC